MGGGRKRERKEGRKEEKKEKTGRESGRKGGRKRGRKKNSRDPLIKVSLPPYVKWKLFVGLGLVVQ